MSSSINEKELSSLRIGTYDEEGVINVPFTQHRYPKQHLIVSSTDTGSSIIYYM
jgi:hypothetical protein